MYALHIVFYKFHLNYFYIQKPGKNRDNISS